MIMAQKTKITVEQEAQIARFLTQKREEFAKGILFNLVNNPGLTTSVFAQPEEVIDATIKMADKFMERLYPIKED